MGTKGSKDSGGDDELAGGEALPPPPTPLPRLRSEENKKETLLMASSSSRTTSSSSVNSTSHRRHNEASMFQRWTGLSSPAMITLSLSIATVGFGVLNNVALTMMSYSMPGFPSFLNYFVAFLSVVFFAGAALVRKEEVFSGRSLSWRLQKQYLILGAITAVNWICVQYAAAWVEADIAQLLAALTLPCVYLFSTILLTVNVERREMLGSIGVFVGVLVGSAESFINLAHSDAGGSTHTSWFNSWYFILAFFISVVFQSLEYVWQEKVFMHPYHGQISSSVFWYQMYGLVPYIAAIPLESLPQLTGSPDGHSVSWAWKNQAGAFSCLVGTHAIDDECKSHIAMAWVIVFVVGFVGMFITQGYLYKRISAFWTTVLQTLVSPLSAVVFAVRPLVGHLGYDQFTLWDGLSFGIIIIALLCRGAPSTPEKVPCPEECEYHGEDHGAAEEEGVEKSGSGLAALKAKLLPVNSEDASYGLLLEPSEGV